MRKAFLVAALCFLGTSATLHAADMVDNPQYVSWSKQKPGTSVTYKMSSDTKTPMGAMKFEGTITQVLKEVKPDACTVEVTNKMSAGGQEVSQPAQTVSIPAKVEKGKEDVPAGAQGQGDIKDVKTGKDTVEVSGKKYEVTTKEFTQTVSNPMPMTNQVKTWTTPDVPGTMVKMETKTSGQVEATTTMQLTDIVIK